MKAVVERNGDEFTLRLIPENEAEKETTLKLANVHLTHEVQFCGLSTCTAAISYLFHPK